MRPSLPLSNHQAQIQREALSRVLASGADNTGQLPSRALEVNRRNVPGLQFSFCLLIH